MLHLALCAAHRVSGVAARTPTVGTPHGAAAPAVSSVRPCGVGSSLLQLGALGASDLTVAQPARPHQC